MAKRTVQLTLEQSLKIQKTEESFSPTLKTHPGDYECAPGPSGEGRRRSARCVLPQPDTPESPESADGSADFSEPDLDSSDEWLPSGRSSGDSSPERHDDCVARYWQCEEARSCIKQRPCIK